MRNAVRWDEAVDDAVGVRRDRRLRRPPRGAGGHLLRRQERYGYLPERALRIVSDRMTIHWAQVFGAAGLGGFRLLPAEGHVITVCTCAACRFAGGDDAAGRARATSWASGRARRPPTARFTLETSAGGRPPAPWRRRCASTRWSTGRSTRPRRGTWSSERQRAAAADRMTVDAGATRASPRRSGSCRGGEQRLLADIGRVDPTSLATLSRARRLRRPGAARWRSSAPRASSPRSPTPACAAAVAVAARPPTSGAPPGPRPARARSWSPT